jgi:hypothetical protein
MIAIKPQRSGKALIRSIYSAKWAEFIDDPICRIILAGLPAIITLLPKDLVTTAPEATMTLLPKVTPGLMVACPPIQ